MLRLVPFQVSLVFSVSYRLHNSLDSQVQENGPSRKQQSSTGPGCHANPIQGLSDRQSPLAPWRLKVFLQDGYRLNLAIFFTNSIDGHRVLQAITAHRIMQTREIQMPNKSVVIRSPR